MTQEYQFPSLDIFNSNSEESNIDQEILKQNAQQIVEKLETYGIKGKVDEIHSGPVVTMFEFEPESGTKISKIASLSDDIAMSLAAGKVRIVAPIPGKARVGFEISNESRQMISLGEILKDPNWMKVEGPLPIALGKDSLGNPVYADLSTMPHLLVAGATGSGKSVGLNVMLASLLTRVTPEQVRMIMIDPKIVELAPFENIPHMLLPIVTDMDKAARTLLWLVKEMERRYQLFAKDKSRDIESYNKYKRTNRIPYIVAVVDEFADLMAVADKEVEEAIGRLAQKARACGIHLILATQRPSVDVITGTIKANFPARMAYKVSQWEDSKTILGCKGAESLLGKGDMLFLAPGSSDLQRIHSSFVSSAEIESLCNHLRLQGEPVYEKNILESIFDKGREAKKKFGKFATKSRIKKAVKKTSKRLFDKKTHGWISDLIDFW